MCEMAWWEDFVALNPAERARAQLVVAFAERVGGEAEAYLRALFPRYWGRVEDFPVAAAEAQLGITAQRQTEILAQLAHELVSHPTPPRGTGSPGEGPSFPASVRHLR